MEVPAEKPSPSRAEAEMFDDRIARSFVWAALFWGGLALVAGMALGAALLGPSWSDAAALSFGRLQPIHRSMALYAFVGNLMYAGAYYATQRLCGVRVCGLAARLHFWLWQAAVVFGVASLFAGMTQGVEYAEFEWLVDAAVCLAALAHAVAIARLVARRSEARMAVALWFFMASALLFPLAYAVGNWAIPTGPLSSVRFWGGPGDALVSWWFAEQAFAYLAIAPALGLVYFLLPRVSGRPLYSQRLAVLHFWSFLLLSSLAGAIHLIGSALAGATQVLAIALTVVVWAPTAAAVVNGVGTLWGASSNHRAAPAHGFLLAALLAYGVIAIEGPLLGLRSVSPLIHFTDWIVGHTHLALAGTVSWIGAAALYYIVPRLSGAELRSGLLARVHLRLAILGLILYVGSMWLAGATAGAMWKDESPYGGLTYTFLDSVDAMGLLRGVRLVGGAMLALGYALMVWNLLATSRGRALSPEACPTAQGSARRPSLAEALVGAPVLFALAIAAMLIIASQTGPLPAVTSLFVVVVLAAGALAIAGNGQRSWTDRLQRRGLALGILILVISGAGAVLALYPTLRVSHGDVARHAPLAPLELAGQAVYVREGCSACHSQMIRSHEWEVERYGEASLPHESAFDHPALWGSRRIGPDLARVGGTRDDAWLADRLVGIGDQASSSGMHAYSHLLEGRVDFGALIERMRTLTQVGVPYSDDDIGRAARHARVRADGIARRVAQGGRPPIASDSELVALIAYLQRLGSAESPVEGTR